MRGRNSSTKSSANEGRPRWACLVREPGRSSASRSGLPGHQPRFVTPTILSLLFCRSLWCLWEGNGDGEPTRLHGGSARFELGPPRLYHWGLLRSRGENVWRKEGIVSRCCNNISCQKYRVPRNSSRQIHLSLYFSSIHLHLARVK